MNNDGNRKVGVSFIATVGRRLSELWTQDGGRRLCVRNRIHMLKTAFFKAVKKLFVDLFPAI